MTPWAVAWGVNIIIKSDLGAFGKVQLPVFDCTFNNKHKTKQKYPLSQGRCFLFTTYLHIKVYSAGRRKMKK